MAGATAHNVDFSNVKEGGQFNTSRIPAGDYLAVIKKVEDAVAKKDEEKTPQYLFSIQVKDRPSSVLPYYCKLQENQLWKLRNIFIAAGKTVPKRKVKVDPNQLVGKLIGITVEDDEYDGKEKSVIQGVFPASELGDSTAIDDSGDDEVEPIEDDSTDLGEDIEVSDEEEEEEVEEAGEADPYADLDRTALKAAIKKKQPDAKFRTSQTDDDLRDILRGFDSAAADDEDEEEAPAPKATAKKSAPKKPADDDLDELDIDDL